MPSWELFDAQPQEYRDAVLAPSIDAASQWRQVRRMDGIVTPEMTATCWGVDRFGVSAPGDVKLREYGFTVENVCNEPPPVR